MKDLNSEDIRGMYNLARYNMGKYILFRSKYYPIVGYVYFKYSRRMGFLTVTSNGFDWYVAEKNEYVYCKIFLGYNEKAKYQYTSFNYPNDSYIIVDKCE